MMRAISLHQPWASLMAVGAKTIETRGRVCHIRGDVAIVSALRTAYGSPEVIYRAAEVLKDDAMHAQGVVQSLPRGLVLCVVEIYECWTSEHLTNTRPPLGKDETLFGNYGPGRFGWATRNLRKLKEPVPCKGHQGFFFLPADVEAKVMVQLG